MNTNTENQGNVEKVKQITAEELDRSITTSRYWGKDEVYSYLTELKQRIEYRLSKETLK
jgi:hypothetical protein